MNPETQLLTAAESPLNGLEFFGLIRQPHAPDVYAEYANYEQLKRMRQAYIVHILDQVLSERTIVAWNDRTIAEEEAEEEAAINGQKVTLDNVFDLAKQEAGADSECADESDSD